MTVERIDTAQRIDRDDLPFPPGRNIPALFPGCDSFGLAVFGFGLGRRGQVNAALAESIRRNRQRFGSNS